MCLWEIIMQQKILSKVDIFFFNSIVSQELTPYLVFCFDKWKKQLSKINEICFVETYKESVHIQMIHDLNYMFKV